MSSSEVAIANLLYRYAELLDGGDLAGTAELFRHARIKVALPDQTIDGTALLELWQQSVILYPDGTPRTRHVITNPIIEIDERAGTATARSCYTVFQATDGFSLQPVAAGRYHDEFERVNGTWRFRFRDYSMLDFAGDLRFHLQPAIRATFSADG